MKHILEITAENINQYRAHRHGHKSIAWSVGVLEPQVLANFYNLRRLTIKRTLRMLDGIQCCQRLKYLELGWATTMSLKPITQLPALSHLSFSSMKGTDLADLKNCPKLWSLEFHCCTIQSIEPIIECMQLRRLSITFCRIPSTSGIPKLKHLQFLHLNQTKRSDTLEPYDPSELNQCPSLICLSYGWGMRTYSRKISKQPQLPSIPTLLRLDTDDGVFQHSFYPNLRVLRYRDHGLNLDFGLYHKLESLRLDHWLSDSIQALKPLVSLKTLAFQFTPVTSLCGLEECRQLRNLRVPYNKNLRDISALSQCTELQYLFIDDTPVTDISSLANCLQLRYLSMGSCTIGSLQALKTLTKLKYLACTRCQLTSLRGIEGCIQLEDFNCSGNLITNLTPLQQICSLKRLACSNDQLVTLEGIENNQGLEVLIVTSSPITDLTPLAGMTKLQTLECSTCSLTSLEPLAGMTKLQTLDCSTCSLTSLEPLGYLPKLRYSKASSNRISSLDGLEASALVVFDAAHNNIETLPDMRKFPALYNLKLDHNRLRSLEGINQAPNIHNLSVESNQLVSLEPATLLPTLRYLYYTGNPLEPHNPRVTRLLHRFETRSTGKSIYGDRQNVHDSHIQSSVSQSVSNLLSDHVPQFDLQSIIESGLDGRAVSIIATWAEDTTVHSQHLLTYAELMAYVWARICRHESKADLLKILAEQVTDAECKCFTGRFNRTLSVLVGFYDDISINISDSSRISAIVIEIGKKIEPYSAEEHMRTSSQALLEIGYTLTDIQPWLDAISD